MPRAGASRPPRTARAPRRDPSAPRRAERRSPRVEPAFARASHALSRRTNAPRRRVHLAVMQPEREVTTLAEVGDGGQCRTVRAVCDRIPPLQRGEWAQCVETTRDLPGGGGAEPPRRSDGPIARLEQAAFDGRNEALSLCVERQRDLFERG